MFIVVRSLARRFAVVLGALALAGCASGFALAQEVEFYAVGHADDWQLFMNPDVHAATVAGTKVVILHTTAGDAGSGTGSNGRPVPFYLAREEGALRAVRFMVNTGGSRNRGPHPESGNSITLNGHDIPRFEYENTVVYFLRLPDGNPGGSGYGGTGNQSLQRLFHGEIAAIDAVDDSTSYFGWSDLTDTLRAIVDHERNGSDQFRFNLPDTDSDQNPGDHSDHLHTAYAMEDVAAQLPCARITYYEEYVTSSRPENVTGPDLMVDAGTWAATASGLSDSYHGSTWDGGHNAWIGRNYKRDDPSSPGCEPAGGDNLALDASASATSDTPSTQQTADKAIDGVADGWPGDSTREWASDGEGVGAALTLDWSSPVTVERVVLYDRPNGDDHIQGATLTVGNAAPVDVSALPNGGGAHTVTFDPPVPADRLVLTVTAVSAQNVNIGLAEIEVFGPETAPASGRGNAPPRSERLEPVETPAGLSRPRR